MKTMQKLFARSWERVACWCIGLLFVVMLVLWLTGFGHERPVGVVTHAAAPERHYLNPATALAFRDKLPPLNVARPSPFDFVVQRQDIDPGQKGDTAQPDGTKRGDVGPTPKAPTQGIIEYLGTITTASGHAVALLLDRNTGETSVVEAGATFQKYKIKSFSRKEAVAEDDKGVEVAFALGARTRLPLE